MPKVRSNHQQMPMQSHTTPLAAWHMPMVRSNRQHSAHAATLHHSEELQLRPVQNQRLVTVTEGVISRHPEPHHRLTAKINPSHPMSTQNPPSQPRSPAPQNNSVRGKRRRTIRATILPQPPAVSDQCQLHGKISQAPHESQTERPLPMYSVCPPSRSISQRTLGGPYVD